MTAVPNVMCLVRASRLREEHQRRGDRLGRGGEMLAQPQLVEAELVGEQRFFGVLFERAPERAIRRMHRHHEHSQTHSSPPLRASGDPLLFQVSADLPAALISTRMEWNLVSSKLNSSCGPPLASRYLTSPQHVDELALAAVLPAHEGFALAQRHDQVGMLVLVQRLMALGAELDAPDADVLVLEQHLRADRAERSFRLSETSAAMIVDPCNSAGERNGKYSGEPQAGSRPAPAWPQRQRAFYRMNRLRSAFLARSPTCFCT